MTAVVSASKQIPIVCPGHTRPLAELQYVLINDNDNTTENSNTYLLSACHDKMPMLRDGLTGDWIGTFCGHKGAVWSCQIDATGSLAATASGDYSAMVWDAITGESLIELPTKGVMKTVTFSPNSQRLATGGKEALLRIYELPDILLKQNNKKSDVTIAPTLEITQESPISKLIWVTDELLLCACMNGKIYLWNTNDSNSKPFLVHTFETKEGQEIRDVEIRSISGSLSEDKKQTILSVASGTKVYFFDVNGSYKLLKEYKMPIHFKDEGGVTLHPNGNLFVAGGSDLWVRVFDFETGEQLECHKGHHGPIRCVRFSPDGGSYASGSEDGTIRLWKT